jgi:hypothetical protein
VEERRDKDRSTGKFIGNFVNITPDGLRMVAENTIEVGKHLQLRRDFPEEISSRKHIEFDVRMFGVIMISIQIFMRSGFKPKFIPGRV